jgi:hypothetical protein
VTTGPTPSKCQLTLGAPPDIVADGGTGRIAVTGQPECPWTVSTQANWITDLSPTSGQGTGAVDFRVAPNTVPTSREAEIVINDNRVRVMQEAAPCRFTLSPVNQSLGSDANTATVTVSAMTGCTWTARSNAGWITITSGDTGDGNGTVAYRVASNSGGPRSGTITIADRTHTVTQGQAAQPPPPPPPPTPSCTFAVNPTSLTIGAGGGSAPVTVTTTPTCAWTATSNAPWLTITSGASGTGSGTSSFTAAANTGAARSGTMTIAGQTVTVSQPAPAPAPCTYSLNPTSASISAIGGTGSITVNAPPGCAWTATNTASWISFTAGSSGNGNGTVDYLVLPNIGAARSSAITIAGQSFTVTQAAALPSCTYTLSAAGTSIPTAGGSGTVDVTAPTGCTWTATTNSTWITITSGASGSGNGTVAFTATPNSGTSRSDTITIAGQTFTVTQ